MKEIDKLLMDVETIERAAERETTLEGLGEQVSLLAQIVKELIVNIKRDRKRVREGICGI